MCGVRTFELSLPLNYLYPHSKRGVYRLGFVWRFKLNLSR